MMGIETLEQNLREACRGRLLIAEPLRNHTSFKVGGPADLLFFPVDAPDLSCALRAAASCEKPVFVMGNGTNLLVRDGGIRGLVVHTGDMEGIAEEEAPAGGAGEGKPVMLTLMAGTLLSKVINYAVSRGYSGMEFAAGIPGSAGGAVWMNAGAHGSTMGDIVTWVELVDAGGEIFRLRRDEIEFYYRGSRWPRDGIVTRIGVRLVTRDETSVLEKVKHCLSERGKRLPLGVGMAGSIFKNPPGDYAGRIIEGVGLKGMKIGNAEVSKKHANVIVNLGGATAGDILQLVEEVASRVREATGVALETEIDIVGEDRP